MRITLVALALFYGVYRLALWQYHENEDYEIAPPPASPVVQVAARVAGGSVTDDYNPVR